MSTPKRPKTTEDLMFSRSPVTTTPYDGNSTTTYCPWTTSTGTLAGTTTTTTPNTDTMNPMISSPSSSCGSPDDVLRTPNTSKDHQRRVQQQFPTPTTNGGYSDLGMVMGSGSGREHKRGRPRSESLTNLMIEGSTSPSAIKCRFCNRVFPREKSLAAHLRTHTGERPYVCDYPGCTKSFTQSGQMKTHQRLHTGERPFICAVPACEMRFTHANRHCPVHTNALLKRDDKFVVKMTPEQNEEVLNWLEKYKAEREDKSTPTRKTPQRSRTLAPGSANNKSQSKTNPGQQPTSAHEDNTAEENQPYTPIQDRSNGITNGRAKAGNDADAIPSSTTTTTTGSLASQKRYEQNDENECPSAPTTPSKNNNSYKSRKGLMVELDMNAGLAMSPLAPLKMKPQPKLIQWQEDEDDDEENVATATTNYYLADYSRSLNTLSPSKRLKQSRVFSPSKRNGNLSSASSSTFNPKKKWLREACMEDLARPLEQSTTAAAGGVLGSPQKLQIKSMNLLRPTVLMLASKDKQIPFSSSSNNSNSGSSRGVMVGGCGDGTVVDSGGGVQSAVGVVGGQVLQGTPVATVPSLFNSAVSPEVESNRRWLGKMALMELANGGGHYTVTGRGSGGGVGTETGEALRDCSQSVSSTTNELLLPEKESVVSRSNSSDNYNGIPYVNPTVALSRADYTEYTQL